MHNTYSAYKNTKHSGLQNEYTKGKYCCASVPSKLISMQRHTYAEWHSSLILITCNYTSIDFNKRSFETDTGSVESFEGNCPLFQTPFLKPIHLLILTSI